jgi:Haem-NO-binding
MYGLVNKAVQGFVTKEFGAEAWDAVRREAGITEVAFVGLNPYPDDITYKLVGAGSKLLNIPAEKILEAFGQYWMTFTAQEGYGPMLAMMGETLPDFLRNLNPMHERLRLTFPKLNPPRIIVSDETSDCLRVHYYSERAGLAPFVIGLLKGLAIYKKTTIEVTHAQAKDAQHDHDEFIVRFWPQGAAI